MRAFRPILAIITVVLLVSCGARRGFVSAYDAKALDSGAFRADSREQLTSVLEARTQQHDMLWTKWNVTIHETATGGKQFFTAVAMFQAPDRVRFGGSRVPMGTVFDVLLNGNKAYLYFNREGKLFAGTIDELSQKTSAIGGLSPRDLVAAVLMQEQLLSMLRSGTPPEVLESGEHLLVAGRHARTRQDLLLMVRRADGLVEEAVVASAQGEEQLRIRYLAYELVENEDLGTREPLPSRMRLEVRREGVTIEAESREYRLAPKFPEAAFLPPRARETLPLSSLQGVGPP